VNASMSAHLAATALLDLRHPRLQALIAQRGWLALSPHDRIGAAYLFVRDEIAFGYNTRDDLPASAVLADGYGQCNTKGTLLMALLRALGIPCRLHGFTIHKALQKGAVTGWAYALAPRDILHSWVEVWHDGRWMALEGFILDRRYLRALQQRFAEHRGPFLGYGVGTPDLADPPVDWRGSDTYIQRDGINQDFGVFDDPDAFYARHGANLSGPRRWVFERIVRHQMNRRVERIRQSAPLRCDLPGPAKPVDGCASLDGAFPDRIDVRL
jgi:transglutaminase-like putative cysteine protease